MTRFAGVGALNAFRPLAILAARGNCSLAVLPGAVIGEGPGRARRDLAGRRAGPAGADRGAPHRNGTLGRAGAAGATTPAPMPGRRLEEPDPVVRASRRRREERSRLFDPSITVERDIRTADGVLIAAAGTRENPLESTDAHPRPAVRRRHGVRRRSPGRWRAKKRAGAPRRSCSSPAGRSSSCAGTADRSSSTRADASPRASASRRRRAWSSRTGTRLRITEIPVESLPRAGSGDRDAPGSRGAWPGPRAGLAGSDTEEED